eukprot:1126312_1
MQAFDSQKVIDAGWSDPQPVKFNRRDLVLYAVGIGSTDLRFVYENHKEFEAFPTYPSVLAFKGNDDDVVSFPSRIMIKLGGARIRPKGPVLDGERFLEILKPLPKKGGKFLLKQRTIGIHDKGRGTLVETERILTDEKGTEYVRSVGGGFYVVSLEFHPQAFRTPNQSNHRRLNRIT